MADKEKKSAFRILLADPDPGSRSALAAAVRKSSFPLKISTVSSPDELKARLLSGRIDLIITGLKARGFRRFQALSMARQCSPPVPVIIATGEDSAAAALDAVNRGAAHYVVKTPRGLAQLGRVVKRLAEKKAGQGASGRDQTGADPGKAVSRSGRKSDQEIEELILLKGIFDSIQDGISILDRKLNIIRVNPAIQAYYKDILPLEGKRCYRAYHRRNRRCTGCPSVKALSGEPGRAVIPRTGPNGERTGWLDIFSFPLKDEKTGKVKGVIEFIRDITERKTAEDALKQSESHYRVFMQNYQGIAYQIDLKTHRPVFFHGKVESITGYSPEDFLRSRITWQQLIHPEDIKKVLIQRNDLRTKPHYIAHGEYRIVHRDGTVRWIHDIAQNVTDDSGKPVLYQGMLQDITDRKHAEQALRENEERYKRITQTLTDYIFTVRLKNGKQVETQHGLGCVAVTGYTNKEFESDPYLWLDMIAEEDRPKVLEQVERITTDLDTAAIEHRIRRKDGQVRWVRNTPLIHRDADGKISGYDGLIQDITERKTVEIALKESEDKFRTLTEESPNMIFINRKGRVVYANRKCEEMMGYTRSEFYSENFQFITLIAPRDRDRVLSIYGKHLKGEEVAPYEYTLITKEGKELNALITTKLMNYNGENALLGMITDITDRKKAENALLESEDKFRTLSEDSPNMIFINRKGRVVYANRKCEEIMGYTRDEFYSENFQFMSLIAPRHREMILSTFARHQRNEEVEPYEYALMTKTGCLIDVITTTRLIQYGGEKAILGMVTDITDRKLAETALRESEIKFRSIFENSRDAIGVSKAGIHVMVNPSYLKMFGYNEPAELTGQSIQTVIAPGEREKNMDIIRRRMKDEPVPILYETRGVRKNGSEFDMQVSVSTYRLESEAYTLVMLRDITAQKQAEMELRDWKKRYDLIVASADEVVYEYNLAKSTIFWSGSIEKVLGYHPSEIRGGMRVRNDMIHPDDRRDAMRRFQEAELESAPYDVTYRFRRKDGEYIWIHDRGFFIPGPSGHAEQMLGMMEDITARKRMENALRESEEKFRSFIEQASEGILLVDEQGLTSECNKAFGEILGIQRERVIGRPFWDVMHQLASPEKQTPERLVLMRETIQQALKTGESPFFFRVMENDIYPEDGKGKTVLVTAFPIRTGTGIRIGCVISDITEHKQAQQALKESEEMLRLIFENASDGISVYEEFPETNTRRLVECNARYAEFGGRTREELLRLENTLPVQKDLAGKAPTRREFLDAILRDGMYKGQFSWARPDGKESYVEYHAVPVRKGGKVLVVGIDRDITDRQKAEEALKESEQNFVALAQNAHDGILIVQTLRSHAYVNQRAADIAGYSVEEMLNMGAFDFLHPDEQKKCRQWLKDRSKGAKVESQFETVVLRKDGNSVPVEVSISKTLWHGRPADLILARDITDRKRMEEQIKADIHEKDVLLRELHHRVKNNLQIVSSLLNLQAHNVQDPAMLSIFQESQNRIRSMALIHEKLYRSDDFARIDFANYIQDLAHQLFRSFGIFSGAVQLKVDIQGIYLDINSAIPSGLIVNELVSNALKHAFPEIRKNPYNAPDKKRHIQISMEEEGGRFLVLKIQDNGVGFPDNLDYRDTPSLGLKVVMALVEQLEGEIELARKNGTAFIIRFPKQAT
jgi:PAS domain S-box-containing protein